MDMNQMLSELRREREAIDEAIQTLERLARGRGNRRGRPPMWLSQVRTERKPASTSKDNLANLGKAVNAI